MSIAALLTLKRIAGMVSDGDGDDDDDDMDQAMLAALFRR
jgi:hypothetical protein